MIILNNPLHYAIAGAIAMTVSPPMAASATTPPVATQTHSLSVGRYLGGTGTNQARGVGYAPNGDIVVGGNFTGAIDNASGDPGKLLLLSADGKQIKNAITLGKRIDSVQVRDRIVVGGDFGVVVLDLNLKPIWKNALSDTGIGNGTADGGQTRVALEPSGRVAVLREKNVSLFSAEGVRITSTKINRTYVNDIAVDPYGRRIYVVGFSNRKRNNVPVQVAFLSALDSNHNLKEIWKTWDFLAADLGKDMADSRLYRVAVGGDGFVTVIGESAGGNSIFRWNGKDLQTARQVKTDKYNDAYNTGSNHILYTAKVRANTGEVATGSFTLTRLATTKGNTIRAKDGSLAVDAKGKVFIGGIAASGIADRDLNQINGQTVSTYAGSDMYLLVLSADLKQRLRWTPFAGAPKGGGTLNALSVDKSGRIAIFGTVEFGNMITTDNNSRPNSADGQVTDAYLGIITP
jgi:hypothetical protein